MPRYFCFASFASASSSCEEWKRDLQNENSSGPQRDSDSRPLDYEAIALTS